MMSSRPPTVSVCVPTFNYGRFLPDCIESVLQQTLTDWELIITDDGSTDDTEAVVGWYKEKDPRITYIRNESRLGMNGNLRRAASYARAPYIKMLCSDDWLAPRCLEVLKDLLEEHPEATLATAACIFTDEVGRPKEINFLFGQPLTVASGASMIAKMATLRGSFGGNSSFMFSRNAYLQTGGYNDKLLYAADLELGARLCEHGAYVHTDEPLFYGRDQPASSSSTDPGRLYDLRDYMQIPKNLFTPSIPTQVRWWQYQTFSGLMTARYLVHAGVALLRKEPQKGMAILKIIQDQGNLWVGIPWVLPHFIARVGRRIAGRNHPLSRPAEPGMGPPPWTHWKSNSAKA